MLEHESTIRLSLFLGVLVLMMVAETCLPRRIRVVGRGTRTFNNLLLVILNTIVLRLLPVLSAVAAASWAHEHHWGVLNQSPLPLWLAIVISLFLFDLIIYWQHVILHYVPILWQIHKVHHADLDLDSTSGLRFHTVEIVLSKGLKCMFTIALGSPPEAVILFEVILNASSIFNHSNVSIPVGIDRYLRWLVVTPDMHRVHHSVLREETDSNFGFNLPWWDWLFRTYQDQPKGSHQSLTLGLSERRTLNETVPLWVMLTMPFKPQRDEKDNQRP